MAWIVLSFAKSLFCRRQKCLRPRRNVMTIQVFPVCCIIPPHILKELALRGAQPHNRAAMNTLLVSEQLRGRREALGSFALATPTGGKRRSIYDAEHQEELPGVFVRGEG